MKTTLPEPEIVTRKGKPISVFLLIADYEELPERVEDAADVAWLKHAREKPQSYRSLESYLVERRDATSYAAEQGIAEEDALKQGMEAKPKEFQEKGAELYAKV